MNADMNGDMVIVGIAMSLFMVIGICGFWIWLFRRLRRRKPGLPAPDRSCERSWYSVGSDAK